MIGGSFEYLVSSLPSLPFQNTEEVKSRVIGLLQKYAGTTDHQIGPVEILDSEVQKFLPVSTFLIFQSISLKNIHELQFQQSNNTVLSTFSKFNFELKEQIMRFRISEEGNEKGSTKSSIEKIIGEGTPLDKEIQIMKYQWDKLEELSVGHYANLEALITYKIKLIILLRWWSFDAEKGFETFNRMITNN